MGFMDSLRDAFGGDRDERPEPADAPASPAEARHVDRDAPEESDYGPQTTGGKHRA